MANTLTNLIPDIYAAVDVVSREMTGMIPRVGLDANATPAAKDETIRWPITASSTPAAVTPAATPPALADETVSNSTITQQIIRSGGECSIPSCS